MVGKQEIMSEMEHVFLSGTFGGELLSLVAAKNVLERHISEDICGDLINKGNLLFELTSKSILENDLTDLVSLSGHPTWKFMNWKATGQYRIEELKTYFMQEIFQEGVLVLNSNNMSQAHTPKIINKIAESFFQAFKKLKYAIESERLKEELKVAPLVPLFKVR